MNNTVQATVSSPLPAEQCITAGLHAEIMYDLDTGQPTLVAAPGSNLHGLREVSATQLAAKVAELRAAADNIEALANEYAAKVSIPEFVQHFGITLIESRFPEVVAGIHAWSTAMADGTVTVVVPEGQAPVRRLAALRRLALASEAGIA